MRRLSVLALILSVIFVGVFFFFRKDAVAPPAPLPESPPVISVPPAAPDVPEVLTLGDHVLTAYGSPTTSIRDDLRLFNDYLNNVFLLVKQRDPRYYATNEDLARFLLGKNANQEAYLTTTHRILNQDVQLTDRHGTPLMIHPQSSRHLEIRSAGADQKPYTKDDLVWPPPKPSR
jgi:hypothetical protein